MRASRSPRRRRLLLLPVVTAVALSTAAVSSVATAVAAPLPAPGPSARTVPVAPTKITLVTGDTVTFSKDSSGHASVDVRLRQDRAALTYTTEQNEHGYFLLPSEAAPYVTAGLVDKQLFNLDYLAVSGYGDDRATAVPVIVQYRQELTAPQLDGRARALSGARRTLTSINGAALDVAKDRAGVFWQRVSTPAARPNARSADQAPALGDGLRKVWLDAKVEALDDTSNTQIGAPTAWAAGLDGTGAAVGVIDTGVDGTHPDLAGRVVAARNFVAAGQPGGGAPADVTDRHGHGTHVATTIAGSGVASGGRYRGVALGADLVIAKALDDGGNGDSSAIIAAMEWEAATQRVDIVSMSLGSIPTDGTDPLSMAVNDLTAEYGTLFVIAAGNDGPGDFTVAAPGTATSALTVGAVDSADKIADFSSRGPRVRDFALKPEISAPGVRIVAGRAAGTSLGAPLDDNYTAASGTSMATPHVAAAAGILAAAHEDWTPDQLKAALVGTAEDTGISAYAQGAGRLDLGRVATQPVVDDVATISGIIEWPYEDHARTTPVTYRNTGSAPVTLDVAVTLTKGGVAVPAGMTTASPSSATVEPGATATVDVTIDPAGATPGWYEGRVTATGGDHRLAVPIALMLSAEQSDLHVKLVGDPAWEGMTGIGLHATLISDDDARFAAEPIVLATGWAPTDVHNTVEATLPLARGATYSINSPLVFTGQDGPTQYGVAIEPEVTIDGDRTIVLDATKLARVNIGTQQPSEAVTGNYFYYQTSAMGRVYTGGSLLSYPAVTPGGYWVSPTRTKPAKGHLGFVADETRIAPQVTLDVPGLSLHPRYVSDRADIIPKFTQDRGVSFASEQDLRAGKDIRGKLVSLTSTTTTIEQFVSDLDLATTGGAAGVVTANPLSWVMYADPYVDHVGVPLLWLNAAEGARLAAKKPRSARIGVEVTTPYEYKSVYYLHDRFPNRIDLASRDRDLTRVDTTYHARFAPRQGRWGPMPSVTETQHTFAPGQGLSIRLAHEFTGPTTRTEYYTAPGKDIMWNRNYYFHDATTGGERYAYSYRGFRNGAKETEDWNEAALPTQTTLGPNAPTELASGVCDLCRQGDRLRLRSLGAMGIGQTADLSDPSHWYSAPQEAEQVHLYRDGTEVPAEVDAAGLPYFTVPAGRATYRLTDVYTDPFAAPHAGTTVTTSWTFRSARPEKATVDAPYQCVDTILFGDDQPCAWQPLVQLGYRLDLPGDDTVRAGRPFGFTVTARTGASAPMAVRDLKVWISSDGKHWTRAGVTRGKDNAYRVTVGNPRTAGPVTIKAEATDRDGNTVSQTIVDAYRVR